MSFFSPAPWEVRLARSVLAARVEVNFCARHYSRTHPRRIRAAKILAQKEAEMVELGLELPEGP